MDTSRPAGQEDDAFALRLSWDDTEDDGGDAPAPPARHRREEHRNGQTSTEPEGASDGRASGDPIGPAVHDIVNRVELRQVGASLDELRREVAELRSAVAAIAEDRASSEGGVESLEDLRDDIAALRGEIGGRLPDGGASAGPGLQPVLDAIVALRDDMVALKRRIAVRAGTAGDATGEQADQIARLVAERLAGWPPNAT